jgi:hypothetical protein
MPDKTGHWQGCRTRREQAWNDKSNDRRRGKSNDKQNGKPSMV